ncbi:Uncharacterised protein [Sphingobacterium daejeonense]|uniref:DUF6712 family protein n=1 Tax=Sphingobacterium daejeonense TaxID=371142 RepID=UPI0010C541D4|nr:hypothetical protein [Sphingobacterium daejeonense]VTP97704.1 Uncharacterised protein [Sphingobacterium daejeonense]
MKLKKEYINDFLIYSVLYDITTALNYKFSNKGTKTITDANASDVTLGEVESVKKYYRAKMDTYKLRLIEYLDQSCGTGSPKNQDLLLDFISNPNQILMKLQRQEAIKLVGGSGNMNLNNLKKYLKDWFKNSAFINTVVITSKDDYSELNNIDYPVAHCEFVNSSVSNVYRYYTFVITISDIQNDKIMHKNVDNIHNDCMMVAQDFIDYHIMNNDRFELDANIQINQFIEDHTDRNAGISFAIRIAVFNEANYCLIPYKAK